MAVSYCNAFDNVLKLSQSICEYFLLCFLVYAYYLHFVLYFLTHVIWSIKIQYNTIQYNTVFAVVLAVIVNLSAISLLNIVFLPYT